MRQQHLSGRLGSEETFTQTLFRGHYAMRKPLVFRQRTNQLQYQRDVGHSCWHDPQIGHPHPSLGVAGAPAFKSAISITAALSSSESYRCVPLTKSWHSPPRIASPISSERAACRYQHGTSLYAAPEDARLV